jgi:hypothetical protein
MSNKKTQFTFVEKTEINKDGKRTYWFTQMKTPTDRIPMLVSGSLSMNKQEAEEMFNLIVDNNGQMESEKVLKTINK